MFQYMLTFLKEVSPFNYVHGIFQLLVCPFAFTCSGKYIFLLWQDGGANLMLLIWLVLYYWGSKLGLLVLLIFITLTYNPTPTFS
jgi:hypothetical protein